MPHPANGKYFAFAQNDTVMITVSGELGHVVARMDSTDSSDQYIIRYKSTTGEAIERWWAESALELPQ